MKKDEYKKSIDNIKIDPIEKAKIYENIQNGLKNKKTKMAWIPFASIGLVSAFAIALIFTNTNNTNKLKGNNIALQNSYNKEIVTLAPKYMSTNNIDVEEGKIVKINASDIVYDDKYSTCSGNLIVENNNGVYTYKTDVKCTGNSKESISKNYQLISSTVNYEFIVDDGVIVTSEINRKQSELEQFVLLKNDLHFVKYDLNGEIEWEFDFTTHERDESLIEVNSIEKIGDSYLVEYSELSNCNISEDGSSSYDIDFFIREITIDGKEKDIISSFEHGDYVNFINKDESNLYYRYLHNNLEKIYKVSIENEYLKTEVIDYNEDFAKKRFFVDFVREDNVYGHCGINTVFKYTLKSNELKEYNLSEKLYKSNISNVSATDKYVYIEFKPSNYNEESKIVKLNNNLEFVKELNYDDYYVEINFTDETNVTIALHGENEDKLITLSEDDEEIDSYKIDTSGLNGYGYRRNIKKIAANIIQVYTIDTDDNSQLLLVFDKSK